MKQNRVSVLTKQNIRYEGYVYAIDKIRKTVFLKEVKCFGTEDREANIFIPPSTKITSMAEFTNEQIQEIKKIQNFELNDQKQNFGMSSYKEQQKPSQREKTVILNQSCTYEVTKSPLPKINQTKSRQFHSQSPDQKYNILSQKPVYITNNYLQLKKMEQYKKLLQFRQHH